MHKKNCRQFAQHLKLIGNLLEQLKIEEVSYVLVNSSQDRSYIFICWQWGGILSISPERLPQNEIDRYLKIVPLVDNNRVIRERLEYTLSWINMNTLWTMRIEWCNM